MIKNNAGGFVFQIDSWERFERFLILGSEGNTYYQNERDISVENAKNVVSCIQKDGREAIRRILDVSEKGRAPKNDPAIFALALACTFGDEATKKLAYSNISDVCRIGTHLFTFCQNIQNLRGWSRGLRKGVSSYFTKPNIDYDVIKYRQRNGWTHKDVVRLCHPNLKDEKSQDLLRWLIGKECNKSPMISGYEAMAAAKTEKEVLAVLENNPKLPWETIPTEHLKSQAVWERLLLTLPMHATLRNLGKMTSIGMFKSPLTDDTKEVVKRLTNAEAIKRSKLHPLAILTAYATYANGQGLKGSLTWTPNTAITHALNEAFHIAFGNVEPTNKNWMLALDVSGSMGQGSVAGSPLKPYEATAAMAMVAARTEPFVEICGFSDRLIKLPITKGDTLATAMQKTRMSNFGGTDAALPIQAATIHKIPVDVFAVYTDNETWAGHEHVTQALEKYRQALGRDAKLIAVGMTATEFSVVDPEDKRQMNVVGFDTGAVQVMADFARA